jgi:hypothetical protein
VNYEMQTSLDGPGTTSVLQFFAFVHIRVDPCPVQVTLHAGVDPRAA